MQLQQFLNNKQAELAQEYRKVEVKSYISVELKGRTIGESIHSINTPLTKIGREITVNEFPSNDDMGYSFKENGTHVIFEVVPKGKRKPIREEFYFLWEVEQ